MKRVIVTSVPGCGKSVFIQALREKGIPIWNADEAVIRLYEPQQLGWYALRKKFGNRFIPAPDAPVDREALTKAILPINQGTKDSVSSSELEAIIHPLAFDDLAKFWQDCEIKRVSFAVAEIPLWFECGAQKPANALIVGIACPEEERKRRLLEVRQWTPYLMAYMDSLQWSQHKKMAACDRVIVNDGSIEDLRKKAEEFIISIENEEQS